jgi:outer membrane lipoprotein-sorting protein
MRVAVLALLALAAAPAAAAPPAPKDVVQKLKVALDPPRRSVRTLTFHVSTREATTQATVAEARKVVDGAERRLLVVLAPDGIRGTAYLVQEGGPRPDVQWVYLPAIRRVRTVVSPEAYTAFLNSDYTYADLGFVSARPTYRVLGEAVEGGTNCWKLESVPKETWYYARVVTWVAEDSGLPVKREFYDPANVLWKVERFEQVSKVDGVPTILHRVMEDVQGKTRTEIDVTNLRYDVALPDKLFQPDDLPEASADPIWTRPQ